MSLSFIYIDIYFSFSCIGIKNIIDWNDTVILIIFSVKEKPAVSLTIDDSTLNTISEKKTPQNIDRRTYGIFLLAMVLFTLGNSTDIFLILHAHELGIPVAMAPLLWMALHLSKSLFSTPGGALSDRIGRKHTIILGWVIYALAYLGFALANKSWQIWPLFVFYGLFYGLTEGPEKALTADIVPQRLHGKGFGLYHLSVGIAALPASIMAGYLWENLGATAALGLGAFFALLAAIVLALGFSGLGSAQNN